MQTAVEWLGQQICDNWNDIHHGARNALEFIEKAKELEKQQIIDAATWGALTESGERYYIDKYGSKGSDGNFKQFSLYEHKETITSADTPTSSQTEISDDEIKKAAHEHGYEHHSFFTAATSNQKKLSWIAACKWYREQLKKKQ